MKSLVIFYAGLLYDEVDNLAPIIVNMPAGAYIYASETNIWYLYDKPAYERLKEEDVPSDLRMLLMLMRS